MALTNSSYLTVWNLDEGNGILNYNQSIYKVFFLSPTLSKGRSIVHLLPWSSFRIYLHSSTCGPSFNFKWLWPSSLSSFTDCFLPSCLSLLWTLSCFKIIHSIVMCSLFSYVMCCIQRFIRLKYILWDYVLILVITSCFWPFHILWNFNYY